MSNEKKTVEVIIRGQQANASLREIQAAARVLNAELRKLPVNSAEFAAKTKEFQEIDKRLKSITNEVKGVGGVFGKIGQEIKAFGIIAAGALGFQWLTDKMRDLIGQNAKLSDSFADIRKTTGMTEAEVQKLNKAFSQMNTRTATADLRAIAVSAGQLGIAKKDILSFTAATDKLVVALGDEFTGGAEEVSNTMGKLRNVFSDIKSDNISNDMLHIGNAVNELGAAGMATGPVISDFANRIGGVGINLGLTSGQVLGLSATLQELNVSTERGGTAISKILLKMTQDTDKFAKVAGMGTKEFATLVNKDLYGAFVKVAEGAKKGGSSATAFGNILDDLGVDGAGASEVFSKLGANTKLLQEKVDLANKSLKGTDSIMNEFAIKNETFAANLDKIGKALNSAFVSGPIMKGMQAMVGWLADLVTHTGSAVEAMEEERIKVNALVIELKSSNTEQKRRKEIYDELKAINPDIVAGIDAENISISTLTDNVKRYNQEQINRIVIQKLQEKVDAANQEAAEKAVKMAEVQAVAYEKLTKVQTLTGKVGREARKIVDDETLSLSEKIKLLRTLAHDEEWYIDKRGTSHRNGQAQMLADIAGSSEVANAEKEYGKAIELSSQMLEEKTKLMKQLGIEETSTTVETKKEEVKTVITLTDEEGKKILALKKKLAEEIAALEIEEYNRGLGKDALELAHVDQKYAKLLAEAKGNKKELNKINQLYASEYADTLQKQEETNANIRTKAAEKLLADRDKLENDIYLASLSDNDREIVLEMQKYEALIAEAEKNGLDIVALKQAEADAINAIVVKQAAAEVAAADKSAKGLQSRMKQAVKTYEMFGNQILSVIDSINTIHHNQDAVDLANNDKVLKAKLDQNDELLKHEIITQQQHDAKALKLQRSHDAKESAIKKAGFERDQKIAKFKAALNLAEAISKIWATYGTNAFSIPVAIAMTAMETVMIGAQIAAINSAPKPYAKGGFNANDNPQGFTNGPTVYSGSASGAPFLAGEAGKEWISPNWMLNDPKTAPIIEHLETVRQNRGFAGGGSNSTKTTTPVFANVNPSAGGNSNNDYLAVQIARLNNHLDVGIPAYLDWDRSERDKRKIEDAKASARG